MFDKQRNDLITSMSGSFGLQPSSPMSSWQNHLFAFYGRNTHNSAAYPTNTFYLQCGSI